MTNPNEKSKSVNISDILLRILEEYESGKIESIKFNIEAGLINEKMKSALDQIAKLETVITEINFNEKSYCNNSPEETTHVLEITSKALAELEKWRGEK